MRHGLFFTILIGLLGFLAFGNSYLESQSQSGYQDRHNAMSHDERRHQMRSALSTLENPPVVISGKALKQPSAALDFQKKEKKAPKLSNLKTSEGLGEAPSGLIISPARGIAAQDLPIAAEPLAEQVAIGVGGGARIGLKDGLEVETIEPPARNTLVIEAVSSDESQ